MPAKFERLADDLRARIGTEWLPGTQLPSETTLMDRYSVSLSTVRKALDRLADEALIDRRHGTGTFVRDQKARLRRSSQRYQWEKDRLSLNDAQRAREGATEYDTGLTREDLSFRADYDTVSATEDLAHAFGVEVGTTLLRRVYCTIQQGQPAPIGITTSYLVRDAVAVNPALLDPKNEPWPGGTQHQLATIGIELDHIEDSVQARPATAPETTALDLRPGSPVVCLRKTSYESTGRVVEVADSIWPGDRIELTFTTHLKPAAT